jgi:hypothetical protein
MLVDNDPVITPRIIGCNHSIKHIIVHTLRVPLMRVAETTAPRQFQADRITGRHGLAPLRSDRAPGAKRHVARRTGLAVVATGGVLHALEVAQ